jgi:hypothetical protein
MVAEIDSLKLELAKSRNDLAELKEKNTSEITLNAVSMERGQPR